MYLSFYKLRIWGGLTFIGYVSCLKSGSSYEKILKKNHLIWTIWKRNSKLNTFFQEKTNISNTPMLDKKMFSFQQNVKFFLISPLKHLLQCSLEASQRCASNDYPQPMFLFVNKNTNAMNTSLI